MNKILFFCFFVIILTPLSNAHEYRFEGSLGYTRIDYDFPPGLDDDIASINGIVYLSQIDSNIGPYLNAAFLNKASSIDANYSEHNFRYNSEDVGESTFYSIGSRFVFAKDIIVTASIVHEDESGKSDFTTIGLGAGLYLTDSSDLTVTYNTNDINKDEDGIDRSSTTIRYYGFNQINNAAVDYNIDLSYVDSESRGRANSIRAGFNYFPSKRLSFGTRAAMHRNKDRHLDSKEIGINVVYFLNASFFGSFAYTYEKREIFVVSDFESTTKTASLSVGSRI